MQFITSGLKGGCKSINLCIVLYLLNRIDLIIEKQMSFILPSIATQIINTSLIQDLNHDKVGGHSANGESLYIKMIVTLL